MKFLLHRLEPAGILASLLVLTLSSICNADTPPTVPPAYQAIYNLDQSDLDAFNALLGIPPKYPVVYTAALTKANANTGYILINANYLSGVQTELQELKAMGVGAVMVEVGFPMLYEPFLTSQGQSQASYVNFYQQVAASVRALNMKLIVENDTLLSSGVSNGWDTAGFYASLDWDQYQQARAETAVTVAQTMHPDYFVVLEEPDTEASNTGQSNVDTPSGANTLLGQILSSLQQAGVNHPKVGAGVGTWLYNFQSFIQNFVTQPIDFVDMHVYLPNLGYLPNALTIASTAAAAGLPVAMSESWLNKELDSELQILSSDLVRSRNVFSFWAPLDAYFIQTMASLANYTQMRFLSMNDAEYFWAYLPYNDSSMNLGPGALIKQVDTRSYQNMDAASCTTTATSYYQIAVPRPDKIPPTAPTGLTGNSANPANVYLTWNAATDNIGVAGYDVVRDGTTVATTAGLSFQDTGLTEGTAYTYTIVAFDMAGNVSLPSEQVVVHTKEVDPPPPPGNLTATVLSSTQIGLSWSPSSDNAGTCCYIVFQGTSPDHLTQIVKTSGTVTSHTVYYLTPGTTYYFGVETQDSQGNTSSMSNIAVATTLP